MPTTKVVWELPEKRPDIAAILKGRVGSSARWVAEVFYKGKRYVTWHYIQDPPAEVHSGFNGLVKKSNITWSRRG
jgi:hypothetical protein